MAGGSTGPWFSLSLIGGTFPAGQGSSRQCGDPVPGVHDGVCPGPGGGDFAVPPAAGRSPVMSHSSTSAVPPWSPMPAATVPACPGAAPPAPRPRPGRRGRMHWLRRFRPRHRSPARRCHPVQASPATHSLARNGLRPCNTEGTGLSGRFACTTHNGRQPNDAHAAVRRAPGQAGSGHRRPDAGSHLEGHLGLAATSRPRPVTPPRLGSRHRATSIHSITPSDGEIRENARRPADLHGRWPDSDRDWGSADLGICAPWPDVAGRRSASAASALLKDLTIESERSRQIGGMARRICPCWWKGRCAAGLIGCGL